MNRKAKENKNAGNHFFSLIELLITVAVIMILIGVLLPALSSARGKAFQISCAGNLKQIGSASSMYSSDYDDYILPGAYQATPSSTAYFSWILCSWRKSGDTFINTYGVLLSSKNGGTFACPTEQERDFKHKFTAGHYAYNVRFHGENGGTWAPYAGYYKRKIAKQPSVVISFMDGGLHATDASHNPVYGVSHVYAAFYRHGAGDFRGGVESNTGKTGPPATTGRTNIVYADGHVEAKTAAQLWMVPFNTAYMYPDKQYNAFIAGFKR